MNKLVDKNDVFREWKAAEGKELNTMILSSIVTLLIFVINNFRKN